MHTFFGLGKRAINDVKIIIINFTIKLKMNNSTNCSTVKENRTILIIGGSIGGVSVLICLLPIFLVFSLRLYRQFTYRVALYQVIAALMYECALVLSSFTPLSNGGYYNRPSELTHYPLCEFTGFVLQFLFWIKLLFVSFIVIHLFTFAVMYKNIKKVEVGFIIFSVLVSLAVAMIPFLTHTYGLAGTWCWITSWRDNCPSDVLLVGLVEQFALYYGPGICLLSIDSVLAIILVIIMLVRLYQKGANGIESGLKHHQLKALKQMAPLLTYSIAFLLLLLPGFANRVYGATPHRPIADLTLSSLVCIASWGWVAGLTLLVHIILMIWSKRKWKSNSRDMVINNYGTTDAVTANVGHNSVVSFTATLSTYYSLQNESEVDDKKFSFVE